jgi:anti-anti-sigma regulatory factor
MSSQLVCRPEQELPVGVLKVAGVLDTVTGDALRSSVNRALSAQPEALLIDVADLEIGEPAALSTLGDIVCQTATWPAVPIVLCGAGPQTATTLLESADCADVGTAASCEQALRDTGPEPEPRRIRMRLRPVPDACRQVRQLVVQACTTWHRRDSSATAALIATELVANVVRHAHTTMEFTVGLRNDRIWMSVRDGSLRMPTPADPSVSDAGGRGLRLVRELTEKWGVMPVSDGKVVWTAF